MSILAGKGAVSHRRKTEALVATANALQRTGAFLLIGPTTQPCTTMSSIDGHYSARRFRVSLVARNNGRSPLTAPFRRLLSHDEVQNSSSLDLLPREDRNV